MNDSTINDGGPAFPWEDYHETTGLPGPHSGMTLRDWFAGQAMKGIIEACTNANLHHSAQTPDAELIAKWSVEQADALISKLNSTTAP